MGRDVSRAAGKVQPEARPSRRRGDAPVCMPPPQRREQAVRAEVDGDRAGGAHEKTFRAIARAEARRIGEAVQRQLVAPELDRVWPGRDHLAGAPLSKRMMRAVREVLVSGLRRRDLRRWSMGDLAIA